MRDDGSVIACASCGRRNRVRPERLWDVPRCGGCHGALPAPAEPVPLDDTTFDAVVRAAPIPVVVDFWAAWCGPCKSFAPTLRDFALRSRGKVLAAKVNVDEARRTAARHAVQSIPTIVVFEGGAEVDRAVGAVSLTQLERLVAARSGP